jgi:hypothetical protein
VQEVDAEVELAVHADAGAFLDVLGVNHTIYNLMILQYTIYFFTIDFFVVSLEIGRKGSEN